MSPEPGESSEPGTLSRLAALPAKIRAKGAVWLWRRLRTELRTPTTRPGRLLRAVNAGLYGTVLIALAMPLRLIWAPRRTLVLFYDLEVSPITYDFCFALVNAELKRLRLGLDRVRVVIVPGSVDGLRREDDDYETAVDRENRKWRIDNILLPLCRLMPSVAGVTVCDSRAQATAIRAVMGRHVYPAGYWPSFPLAHAPNHVLDAARSGRVARPFRATEQARRHVRDWLAVAGGRRVVTITLRNYGFMPARNSNLAAWAAFAADLVEDGFYPVFIPDTETALAPLPAELSGFTVFSEAAWNLGLRMALYEAAWLNMMINNGPFGCVAFSEAPYVMLKILTPDVRMTSEAYMRQLGYEIGDTPPFAGPCQRWVWEDDDLSVIRREFDRMRGEIEAGCRRS